MAEDGQGGFPGLEAETGLDSDVYADLKLNLWTGDS